MYNNPQKKPLENERPCRFTRLRRAILRNYIDCLVFPPPRHVHGMSPWHATWHDELVPPMIKIPFRISVLPSQFKHFTTSLLILHLETDFCRGLSHHHSHYHAKQYFLEVRFFDPAHSIMKCNTWESRKE